MVRSCPLLPSARVAIALTFAIVALLSLSRASALSSATRLAAQSRGPLGVSSRNLARQGVKTALASPLWRPAQPLPVLRSRRLLCSSSALDPPPPARPDLLAPVTGLEQPHVDVLPISEVWKGRLRSLTRPAVSHTGLEPRTSRHHPGLAETSQACCSHARAFPWTGQRDGLQARRGEPALLQAGQGRGGGQRRAAVC